MLLNRIVFIFFLSGFLINCAQTDGLVVAFVIGVALHFKDLVENELFKYPQEW